MDGSEEVRYGGMVKSAVRVIEILEFFEAERRALKVSEIVEGLRMPQSSVSTLMKTLAAQGYVEFDPETRRYRPAPRLAFLGHWALGGPGNIEQVQNLMRALAEQTEESVLLGGQKGLFMQYLSIIESPHNLRFSLRPGLVRPLHGSGIGIMLLTIPILLPVLAPYGVDPVHFGVVMIYNLCMGVVTPPVGTVLFVSCGITGQPITRVVRPLLPRLVPLRPLYTSCTLNQCWPSREKDT